MCRGRRHVQVGLQALQLGLHVPLGPDLVDDVPWGYLAGVLVALAAVVVAVRPPPTNGPHPTLAFVFGTASSEVPMVFLLLLIGSTVLAVASGDLDTPSGWVAAGLAAAGAAGLISVQVEAFAARRAVVNAVDAAVAGGGRPAPSLRPAERWRAALAPLRWPSLDIQVVRNLTYARTVGPTHSMWCDGAAGCTAPPCWCTCTAVATSPAARAKRRGCSCRRWPTVVGCA